MLFVTTAKSWKPSQIVTKRPMLDVTVDLDPAWTI